MKRCMAAYLTMFLSAVAAAGAANPPTGKPAPRVEIAKWLSGEIGGAAPLAGKTVLLEFFATWCGPCRMMVPHINELAAKFGNDRVIFMSISAEDPMKVAAFAKALGMRSRVVIDREGATHRAYGIDFIPYAFLIDPGGNIRWQGHPAQLTEPVMTDLLKPKIN